MTEDTRKAMAMIKPIAKELGIKVQADEQFLYCNCQAIGIAGNSTYATLTEFIAYCMAYLEKCQYRFRGVISNNKLAEDAVKRYWVSAHLLKKIREGKQAEPE